MATPSERVTTMADLRRPEAPEAKMPDVRMGFHDLQGFELMQRACKALAASTLVPQQFQGHIPNCLIALEMAQRIGASPLMVMQNLYIVHGRPGWSAKFLIASFNQCGRFAAVRFEWSGERDTDGWGCRAWATEKATNERITGPLITIALAKKEGWYSKSGSKWQTIPELMLMYRAAAWMINTHAPEISMGLNSAEELGDVYDARPGADGGWSVETSGDLRAADAPLVVGAEPEPTPQEQPTQRRSGRAAKDAAPATDPGAPTLVDLLAAIDKGQPAEDIIDAARALPEADRAKLEAALTTRDAKGGAK